MEEMRTCEGAVDKNEGLQEGTRRPEWAPTPVEVVTRYVVDTNVLMIEEERDHIEMVGRLGDGKAERCIFIIPILTVSELENLSMSEMKTADQRRQAKKALD
eukprot:TRINITY_DN6982_c0_g3_i1.p3 TRINITY_DN6982_c0_g3~~TRINITY_DN6982_c0_g3_i1.p3  ORF type:complete len:102 (-),score=18.23 TRINITY_DN6982_c0_g3_i1:1526-1831(-)